MANPGQTNGPQDIASTTTISIPLQFQQQQQSNNFEPLDKSSSNTLKVCIDFV